MNITIIIKQQPDLGEMVVSCHGWEEQMDATQNGTYHFDADEQLILPMC